MRFSDMANDFSIFFGQIPRTLAKDEKGTRSFPSTHSSGFVRRPCFPGQAEITILLRRFNRPVNWSRTSHCVPIGPWRSCRVAYVALGRIVMAKRKLPSATFRVKSDKIDELDVCNSNCILDSWRFHIFYPFVWRFHFICVTWLS